MAGSVNKVILIGNVGRDPEVRNLDNNTKVASFSIATSEVYNDRSTGERKEITDWHNIVAWRGLADVVDKYVQKGMKVYVEGKLKTRSWQDKEGSTRYTTEIVIDDLSLLTRPDSTSPKQDGPQFTAEGTPPNPSPMDSSMSKESPEDDLPF